MGLTKEERLFIKNELPHGMQLKIAKQANVSLSYVNQYLNGKKNSERIEKLTLQEYKKVKLAKKKALDIINGIL